MSNAWLSKTRLSKTWLSKTWLSKTIWVAVFCSVGLGPMIAIGVAAPRASLVVEPAQDQSQIEPAFAVNELAKSDRLDLPNVRAEPRDRARGKAGARAEHHRPVRKRSNRPVRKQSTSSRTGIGKMPTPAWLRSPSAPEQNRTARPISPPEPGLASDRTPGVFRSLDLSPRCNL